MRNYNYLLVTYETNRLFDPDSHSRVKISTQQPKYLLGRYKILLIFCDYSIDEKLSGELRQHVAKHLGPLTRLIVVKWIDKLPKTCSGKIMRLFMKARAQGLPEGDLSTLED